MAERQRFGCLDTWLYTWCTVVNKYLLCGPLLVFQTFLFEIRKYIHYATFWFSYILLMSKGLWSPFMNRNSYFLLTVEEKHECTCLKKNSPDFFWNRMGLWLKCIFPIFKSLFQIFFSSVIFRNWPSKCNVQSDKGKMHALPRCCCSFR